jgi:hypothetical protein
MDRRKSTPWTPETSLFEIVGLKIVGLLSQGPLEQSFKFFDDMFIFEDFSRFGSSGGEGEVSNAL